MPFEYRGRTGVACQKCKQVVLMSGTNFRSEATKGVPNPLLTTTGRIIIKPVLKSHLSRPMCTMRAIACCAAALLLPASSAGLSTKVALWRVSETAQQAPVTTQLRREIALVQATRLRGGTTRPPKLSRSHEMYGPRSSDALALESAGWRQQAEPLAASNPLLEDGTSGPSKPRHYQNLKTQ